MSLNADGKLRVLQRCDLEMVRGWRNRPSVRQCMYTQHAITYDEHQNWFESAEADPYKYLLILERDGRSSGFVNLTIADVSARRVEWGFYLAPDVTPGTGSLLGRLALRYVFKDLGQHKLCGEAISYNERSIRFHEQLGFCREASLRDHHFDGLEYYDVIVFGLLATEWNGDICHE